MSKHLLRDLDHLKKEILFMGAMVEDAMNRAITAVIYRRAELAEQVMKGEDTVNMKEIAIEEDCLKILALHQPVAADLRFIVSMLKVNNTLERMGDVAVNIAERALYLASQDPVGTPLDFSDMVAKTRAMVRESLDSLINRDSLLARAVCRKDDEVDEINRQMFGLVQELIRRDPETADRALHMLSVSRHLERIADLATNIAEDVVFMVEGEIIKHHFEDFRRQEAARKK
jgi:phosphate transport system protein